MTTIAENIARVQDTIAAACARTGRDPVSVTLIAVSKTHPASAVVEAVAAGVQHFGENRVEEAETKISSVRASVAAAPLTWHMIGQIQSRKAKAVAPLFGVVHSVDTLKLAIKLADAAVEGGKTLDVLLEMNVSGEASKGGFVASAWARDPAVRDALFADVAALVALPGVRVRGLMTMAPIVARMEAARPVFESLAGLRAALSETLKIALPDLSMGMTDDYPVAIEAGATLVRVGRAIFGDRQG
ncbi:MAG: YggS family pyridoxal phosphate-dependent enzyme [Chloroflexota bacterium]|nr:YggS family pyridoxal phosphate-dependent enzyme [Chloroflexota bacterium]